MRAITDESGDKVASYRYDAYGNPISSSSQVYNPFGYTGEYTDSESGLIYLRARYYDPSTRQFLTRDPIEDITGQAYNYAAGNPTNFRDPSGKFVPIQVLCPECVVVSTVAGGLIGLGAYALFHQGCFDLVEAAKWTAIGVLLGCAIGALVSEFILPWVGAHIAYWLGGGAAATPVIGGLRDFENYVLQPGETRLLVRDWVWSIKLNDIWIGLYIKAGQAFKTISPIDEEHVWSTARNGPTVFFREIQQLVDAGHAAWIEVPSILFGHDFTLR